MIHPQGHSRGAPPTHSRSTAHVHTRSATYTSTGADPMGGSQGA
ncbi:hypothetical protein LINPERHAP1_LOCUS36889 [Linum perenne]